jgi:hypothetical protein
MRNFLLCHKEAHPLLPQLLGWVFKFAYSGRLNHKVFSPHATFAAMKANNSRKESITAPLLKEAIEQHKANAKANRENASSGSKPLNPPALYEDSGEGYNPDFTFPQE